MRRRPRRRGGCRAMPPISGSGRISNRSWISRSLLAPDKSRQIAADFVVPGRYIGRKYHLAEEAAVPSFDIVSRIELAEVDNAVAGIMREIGTRFDFKG